MMDTVGIHVIKMITPASNISSLLIIAFEKHAFVSDDENIFLRFKERRPFKFTSKHVRFHKKTIRFYFLSVSVFLFSGWTVLLIPFINMLTEIFFTL
jgi:hypothetical protein